MDEPADDSEQLTALAALLRERNEIDRRIGAILDRPMATGHAGEWIAARIFDIHLEGLANAPAIDGRFQSGPLAGKSVNVKWYLKREGMLDVTPSPLLDYYLVLAGPKSTPKDLRSLRPWVISSVHLFDAKATLASLTARGARAGIASSVPEAQWTAQEIYPTQTCELLPLTDRQRDQIALFGMPD